MEQEALVDSTTVDPANAVVNKPNPFAIDTAKTLDHADTWRTAADTFRQIQTTIIDLFSNGENSASDGPQLHILEGGRSGEQQLSDDSSEDESDDETTTRAKEPATPVVKPPMPPPPPLPVVWSIDSPDIAFRATGDGLCNATAGQTTTFTIEAYDIKSGERRRVSSASCSTVDHGLTVSLTGAAVVRTRVFAEPDAGTFTCEYRATQSGRYRLAVLRNGQHLPNSPFALSVKAAPGGLKDWKQSRSKEVSSLKAKRAAAKANIAAKPIRREPSPRISPAEQLQKAYALALSIARGDKKQQGGANGSKASSSSATTAVHAAAAPTDEHVLAV